MSKFTFVIPLGKGSTWEDNELRYMLRSLEKYCHFDYDVITYCTRKLDWLNCKQVVVERTYPQKVKEYFAGTLHYENYYDVINKLKVAIEDEDLSEEFSFIYDDMILTQDMYLHDFKKIIAGNHYDNNKEFFDKPKGKWMQTIHASMEICKANGYPLYNYETHLPRFFTKSNVRAMFKRFDPEKKCIPYALSSVYFNMFYEKPDVCYFDKNTIKAGFYGVVNEKGNDLFLSKSNKEIKEAIREKTWINYSNAGLTGTMKLWIEKSYQDKSRFEK